MNSCDKFKCEKDISAECENKERFDCVGNSGFQRCGCECCEYCVLINGTACCVENSLNANDDFFMEPLQEQQEQM